MIIPLWRAKPPVVGLRGGFVVVVKNFGVPVMAPWLVNPTRNHEVAGSIPGLAWWVKDLALPRAVV